MDNDEEAEEEGEAVEDEESSSARDLVHEETEDSVVVDPLANYVSTELQDEEEGYEVIMS